MVPVPKCLPRSKVRLNKSMNIRLSGPPAKQDQEAARPCCQILAAYALTESFVMSPSCSEKPGVFPSPASPSLEWSCSPATEVPRPLLHSCWACESDHPNITEPRRCRLRRRGRGALADAALQDRSRNKLSSTCSSSRQAPVVEELAPQRSSSSPDDRVGCWAVAFGAMVRLLPCSGRIESDLA